MAWALPICVATAVLAVGVTLLAQSPGRRSAGVVVLGSGLALVAAQRGVRALAIRRRDRPREPALVLGRTDLEVHDRTLFRAVQVIPGHLVVGVERTPAMAAPALTLAERPPTAYLRLRQPLSLVEARGLPGLQLRGYSLPATVAPRTPLPRLGIVSDDPEAVAKIERWLMERDPSGSAAVPEPPMPSFARLGRIAAAWAVALVGLALIAL